MTYEVQIYTICDNWTNTWTVIAEDGTETPETFATAAGAEAAIDEFLAEIRAEIDVGQRQFWESYDRNEFRVVRTGEAT